MTTSFVDMSEWARRVLASCLDTSNVSSTTSSFLLDPKEWHREQEDTFKSTWGETLWTRALKNMSMSHSYERHIKLDVLSPRMIIWPCQESCLVRSMISQEKQIIKYIEQDVDDDKDPFVFSMQIESWRSLVAHVAMHKDLKDPKTLEWMYIAATVLTSLPHKSFDESIMRILFESLVKLMHQLKNDKATRVNDDNVLKLFGTSGNPNVLLSPNQQIFLDALADKNMVKQFAQPVHHLAQVCKWTDDDAASVQGMQWMPSHKSRGLAIALWYSWMFNEDRATMNDRLLQSYRSERKLFDMAIGDLTTRVKYIVDASASFNEEYSYDVGQEWLMLDDEMRQFIVPHLSTWHSSVHPLQELACMTMMPSVQNKTWYLASRLVSWARETHSQHIDDMSMIGWQCQLSQAKQSISLRARRTQVQESGHAAKQMTPSLSPSLSTSGEALLPRDDSSMRCKSSSLIEKLKMARQEIVTSDSSQEQVEQRNDSFFEEDESIRALLQVSGVQDASKKDWMSMIDMVCNSLIKRDWPPVLEMLPHITLNSWKNQLSPYASVGAIVSRGVYEDLCRMVRMVPTSVLLSERARVSDNADMPLAQGIMTYWQAILMRHGTMSRLIRRQTIDAQAILTAADAVMTSLASVPIAYNVETSEQAGMIYGHKTMMVWSLLGANVCARMLSWNMRDKEAKRQPSFSQNHMAAFMLSHMARPGWMRLEDEWIVWHKVMDCILKDEDSMDEREFDWLHGWMQMVCTPVASPDDTGIVLSQNAIIALARRANVSTQTIDAMDSRKIALDPLSSAQVAFGLLSKRLRDRDERLDVSSKRVCQMPKWTRRGAQLFLIHVGYLIRVTLKQLDEYRDLWERIHEEWQNDWACQNGSKEDGVSLEMIVAKWLAWIDKNAYGWVDADLFRMGARISLYGDHDWVRELYWSEWMAKPWFLCRNASGKGLSR